MKIAYFDCIAGASGDMILGALVDAGLPLETLRTRLDALHLPDFELRARQVAKNAFAATKVDVVVADDVPERHLADIIAIVQASDLSPDIKTHAIAIFRKVGAAEANIHGTSMDHVHLHELGGVDTIVDVVGALVGLEALGVEQVMASPVPLGRGFIRGAHGQIPLPAPATVALLQGVPVVGSPLPMETVTPTGAALLASLVVDFGPLPAMTLDAVGYGAGSRDLPIPNVLRVFLGELQVASYKLKVVSQKSDVKRQGGGTGGHTHSHDHGHPHAHAHAHETEHSHAHSHMDDHEHAYPHTHPRILTLQPANPPTASTHSPIPTPHSPLPHPPSSSELAVLETNIDDLNPEVYEYVMECLFEAGALDVFFAPIQMKKNRPATLLRVLCRPDDAATMTDIVFMETTTLGIREHRVKRHALAREAVTVDTAYGPVRVKVARLGKGQTKIAPEYEDCRRAASEHNVPLREVYAATREAVGLEDVH